LMCLLCVMQGRLFFIPSLMENVVFLPSTYLFALLLLFAYCPLLIALLLIALLLIAPCLLPLAYCPLLIAKPCALTVFIAHF